MACRCCRLVRRRERGEHPTISRGGALLGSSSPFFSCRRWGGHRKIARERTFWVFIIILFMSRGGGEGHPNISSGQTFYKVRFPARFAAFLFMSRGEREETSKYVERAPFLEPVRRCLLCHSFFFAHTNEEDLVRAQFVEFSLSRAKLLTVSL